MTERRAPSCDELAGCHGFVALARDGLAGVVAGPLLPPGTSRPEFLVLRVLRAGRRRRPLVSARLVDSVDSERRFVYLRSRVREVAELPEWLPDGAREGRRFSESSRSPWTILGRSRATLTDGP